MMLRSSARPAVIALSLAVVLIVITSAFGSLGNTTMNTTCRQVAIQLDTKEVPQEQLVSILREQLNVCGISATEAEIQKAARGSLNLIGKAKDPERGVIYVNTKKFTICASWGKDKDFCKSH